MYARGFERMRRDDEDEDKDEDWRETRRERAGLPSSLLHRCHRRSTDAPPTPSLTSPRLPSTEAGVSRGRMHRATANF